MSSRADPHFVAFLAQTTIAVVIWAPTICAGDHDSPQPTSETLQAKEALEKRGKEADVVIYQDEGHGFRKLDNRLDAYKKTTEFLNKHLQ